MWSGSEAFFDTQKKTQTHEREKRATTHGQQDCVSLSRDSPAEHLGGPLASAVKRIAALMTSLAEHLGGRMASGALRDLSRFLTRHHQIDVAMRHH